MSSANPPDPRRWRALSVCLIAGFMTLLDVSIVNVALPSMQQGLGASAAELSWVVSGYALTFGLVLVSSGRLGDDRGRRRMFLVALALFTLTSALAGLATDPTWLIVLRLLQGAAGGMLTPQVVGFIQQLFHGPERGRAFGLFGAVIGVSTAVGPLLGGLLLHWAGTAEGWRWVFYVNVPIGILGLVVGARVLPRDQTSGRRRPLDAVGALLLGLAVVALMLPLVLSEQDPAAAPWWLLAVAAVLLVLFVVWERRALRTHGHPLVDFALLRTRSYALGTSLGLLYFAGFTSIFFVLTLYFQQGQAYTPLQAGLALTPFALGSAISSAVGGRVVSRFGTSLVVGGLVVVLAGLVATDVILRLGPAQVGWAIAVPLLVAGLGSGLVIAPNQTLALQDVPPREGGTAAGVLQTGQRVGSAVGISIVGSVFFGRLAENGGDWGAAISAGLLVTVGLVGLALLAGVTDLLAGRRTRRNAPVVDASVPVGPASEAAGSSRADGSDGPEADMATPPTGTPDGQGVRGGPGSVSPTSSGLPAANGTSGAHSEWPVRGRVLDDDGAPLPGAVLTLIDAGGRQAARSWSGPDGRFGLDASAGASYQLVLGAPDRRPAGLWVRVPGAGLAPEVPDVVLARRVGVGG